MQHKVEEDAGRPQNDRGSQRLILAVMSHLVSADLRPLT